MRFVNVPNIYYINLYIHKCYVLNISDLLSTTHDYIEQYINKNINKKESMPS